jgi:two-component system, cell cycle sensor histidine kinase and response regulator CckA
MGVNGSESTGAAGLGGANPASREGGAAEPDALVLIVDDAPDNLALTGMILRREGYGVITAGDGLEGYELALSARPDVVISDLTMPRVDGIEMCRRIRGHAEIQSTPILFVSAVRKDSESVTEGFKAGADDYLEAPYDTALLVAKVGRLLERKRASEELAESEDRYRCLATSAFDGVVVHQDGVIKEVNLALAEMFRYTPEELAGRDVMELIPSEQRDVVSSKMSADESVYESLGVRRDGTQINVEISPAKCLYRGSPARLVAVRDITGRKRVERELRQSEERYRDLVENAYDLIYSHDLEGNYTSINKAVEQVTGYTREEALKMNLAQTVAPEYLEKAREMIARKLAGERSTAYELEIIAKDGRRIKIEVNSALIFQEGVPVGVQGIARDVTERKELEDQLRQAQKMEAVGMLAGGIAHDFNNLLSIIIGYSDLTLRRLATVDPLRHNVEEIKRAGERAANLTRQLLAFSRKQVLQPKVLDLNEVVTEMERMLRRLIGEDIELRAALEPGLGSVKADPGQIEQVLLNLCVNARDAMPRGGKLTIGTEDVYLDEGYAAHHAAVKTGRYVMLAVSDTGTGMDEATQARVFEPFFTTKGQGKGTGLGLSTVYGIVKQSGGYIWVYSEVSRGTTFKVYLPRVDEGAQEYRQGRGAVEEHGGTETVLLVEDDELVRNLTRSILSDLGYRVLAVANASAALSVCEHTEGPIHLLLTDVVMPGMSGRELAERLARLRPETRVLFMSGYTDDAIVHHGVLDEGVNFIQKPFTPEALARKVREVLGRPA